MKETRHLYDILDINHDATDDEIKEAFRNKAHVHHPDKGGEPAKFADILEAYRVLSDPKKRAQYDKSGYTGDEKMDDNEVSIEVMRNLFMAILSDANIANVNIPTKLMQMVIGSIDGFKKSKKATNRRIALIKSIQARLHYKKDDADILHEVLIAEEKKLNNSHIFLDYQLKIYSMIVEKIGDYTYDMASKKS